MQEQKLSIKDYIKAELTSFIKNRLMHVPSEPQATDLKAKVDVYMPVDCEWNEIDIRDLAWLSNKVTNILKGRLNLGITPNLMYCSVQCVSLVASMMVGVQVLCIILLVLLITTDQHSQC